MQALKSLFSLFWLPKRNQSPTYAAPPHLAMRNYAELESLLLSRTDGTMAEMTGDDWEKMRQEVVARADRRRTTGPES